MTAVAFDRCEVADALAADEVLAYYGWSSRRTGYWLRARECPACGTGESDAFAVADHGFRCHRCGAHGDLLALIALFEGLDVRAEFPRVLETAATLAGVEPASRPLTVAERALREREMAQRRATHQHQRQQREEQRLAGAIRIAANVWSGLERRSAVAESYLVQRGVGVLVGRDDLVRFDHLGSVRVPVYHWDRRICDVQMRYLPAREPGGIRTRSETGCTTLGAFGGLHQLEERTGAVVVTEGLFDYLSAVALWPDRAVLGAAGAGRLAVVTRMVAERCRGTGRELFLVPHHDQAGIGAAFEATRMAADAGMLPARVHYYDTRPAGDLNDWLRTEAPR